MSPRKLVVLDCDAKITESRKAVCLAFGDEREWIPKSQIEDHEEDREGIWKSVTIPEWLAIENNLDGYISEEL